MKTGGDDWKTPLGVYERAIAELASTRQELQTELNQLKDLESWKANLAAEIETAKADLQAIKSEQQNFQSHLETTKKELNNTQIELKNVKTELESSKAELTDINRKLETTNSLRIEHGVWEGTAENTPGWSILNGDGKRVFRDSILFKQGFSEPPKVVIGISYFDIIRKANSRLNVKVAKIDKNGFYFHLQTYWDTQIWAVGVNWLAYGY